MNPHRKMSTDELVELQKMECNHFVNGECRTAGCMRWEGTTLIRPLEFVGCLYFQTVQKLWQLQDCLRKDRDCLGFPGKALRPAIESGLMPPLLPGDLKEHFAVPADKQTSALDEGSPS